tara:strand:- start:559 stop:681 length:123 start_codon:yes stop_codon:yes gene_type:complete
MRGLFYLCSCSALISAVLNYDLNAEKGWGVDVKQYLLDLE